MQTVIQKSLHLSLTRMPAIIDLGKPIATTRYIVFSPVINHSPQPANILPDSAPFLQNAPSPLISSHDGHCIMWVLQHVVEYYVYST